MGWTIHLLFIQYQQFRMSGRTIPLLLKGSRKKNDFINGFWQFFPPIFWIEIALFLWKYCNQPVKISTVNFNMICPYVDKLSKDSQKKFFFCGWTTMVPPPPYIDISGLNFFLPYFLEIIFFWSVAHWVLLSGLIGLTTKILLIFCMSSLTLYQQSSWFGQSLLLNSVLSTNNLECHGWGSPPTGRFRILFRDVVYTSTLAYGKELWNGPYFLIQYQQSREWYWLNNSINLKTLYYNNNK